jgi:iron-sulfur cluster repair protein YtfE (RIC family)
MRINNYVQQHVDHVVEQIPEAVQVLRERNISANRHSLANAAATTGVSSDELMAVLDHRSRRAARRNRRVATTQTANTTEVVA